MLSKKPAISKKCLNWSFNLVKVWNLEKVRRTSTVAKSPTLAFHFKDACELGGLSLATKEIILNVVKIEKAVRRRFGIIV